MKPLINFKKLIITIWILLWVILIMLLIGKMLFHQWYPIVLHNNNLLSLFNYIDNHIIIRQIIAMFFYCLNGVMIFYITTKQRKYNYIWTPILIALCIISEYIKYYYNYMGVICEIIIGVIIPIFYNIKIKTYKNILVNILMPIILNIILALWQINILFIRGINDLLKNLPTAITTLLQIDYYIFLIITWMGVVYIMSTWGFWFFGKSQLEAMKAKELSKENPDMEYLAKLDKEIAKRKGE